MVNNDSVSSNRIIYTPSNFAKSSLLYLQETGTLTALKPHKSARTDLDSYLFFTVLEGNGELEYCDETYPLNKGACVFINCRKGYSHFTYKDLWKLEWIHFNGEAMEGVYQKYLERGGAPCFYPEETSKYTEIINSVYETANSDDFIKDMRINERLNGLLTLIMEMSWQPLKQQKAGKNPAEILKSITKYISENLNENFTLEEISNRFYINKFHLARLFKKEYGYTLFDYISERRITKAKKLLRFTDKSVEEVCYDCGFNDPNYFSRVFRKIENRSPSEYRRLWIK